MSMQEVNEILKQYHNDPADIIAILQDVQRTYRYLPEEVLAQISDKLDIPLSRVYHLATFFRAFSLDQRGEHVINVCMGTACHVRGSPRILDALERGLKIKAGTTTADLSCTLETVNCVGACALGPVVVVDEKSLGKMTPQKAERMLKQLGLGTATGEPAAAAPARKAAPTDGGAKGAESTPVAPPPAKATAEVPAQVTPAPQEERAAKAAQREASTVKPPSTPTPKASARPAAGKDKAVKGAVRKGATAKGTPAGKAVSKIAGTGKTTSAGRAAGVRKAQSRPIAVRTAAAARGKAKAVGKKVVTQKASAKPGAAKKAGGRAKTTGGPARSVKKTQKNFPKAKSAGTGAKESARTSVQAKTAGKQTRGSGKSRK